MADEKNFTLPRTIDSTMWEAFCSDTTNSVADCTAKTTELLAKYPETSADRTEVVGNMCNFMRVVYANRGNDQDFCNAMFNMDVRQLKLMALLISCDSLEVDPEAMFASYLETYGQDLDYAVAKVRYIVHSNQYAAKKDEVNGLMEFIQSN